MFNHKSTNSFIPSKGSSFVGMIRLFVFLLETWTRQWRMYQEIWCYTYLWYTLYHDDDFSFLRRVAPKYKNNLFLKTFLIILNERNRHHLASVEKAQIRQFRQAKEESLMIGEKNSGNHKTKKTN